MHRFRIRIETEIHQGCAEDANLWIDAGKVFDNGKRNVGDTGRDGACNILFFDQ